MPLGAVPVSASASGWPRRERRRIDNEPTTSVLGNIRVRKKCRRSAAIRGRQKGSEVMWGRRQSAAAPAAKANEAKTEHGPRALRAPDDLLRRADWDRLGDQQRATLA